MIQVAAFGLVVNREYPLFVPPDSPRAYMATEGSVRVGPLTLSIIAFDDGEPGFAIPMRTKSVVLEPISITVGGEVKPRIVITSPHTFFNTLLAAVA